MRIIIFLLAIGLGHQVSGQRQREITDFVEKWRIENVSIESIGISGLPGAIEIIGNNTQTIAIKVVGEEVYLLEGGATGLAYILSKDKNDHYRIQGIGDQSRDVTYQISIPNHADLSVDFGGQVNNSSKWQIDGMKGEIQLQRMQGDIEINGAIGPVSIINYNGNLNLGYQEFSQKEPHSISSLGNITIHFDQEDKVKVELNTHGQIDFKIGDEFEAADKPQTLSIGRYEFSLNEGSVPIKLHAYTGQLMLNTTK